MKSVLAKILSVLSLSRNQTSYAIEIDGGRHAKIRHFAIFCSKMRKSIKIPKKRPLNAFSVKPYIRLSRLLEQL